MKQICAVLMVNQFALKEPNDRSRTGMAGPVIRSFRPMLPPMAAGLLSFDDVFELEIDHNVSREWMQLHPKILRIAKNPDLIKRLPATVVEALLSGRWVSEDQLPL
jgi:hypothetical protein